MKYTLQLFIIFILFSYIFIGCEEEEKTPPLLKITNKLDESVKVLIDVMPYVVYPDTIIEKSNISIGLHDAVFVFPPNDTIGIISDFPIEENKTTNLFISMSQKGDTVIYFQITDKDLSNDLKLPKFKW